MASTACAISKNSSLVPLPGAHTRRPASLSCNAGLKKLYHFVAELFDQRLRTGAHTSPHRHLPGIYLIGHFLFHITSTGLATNTDE